MAKSIKSNHFVLLSVEEIKQIIIALEKQAGKQTELGNDLKLVLAGKL